MGPFTNLMASKMHPSAYFGGKGCNKNIQDCYKSCGKKPDQLVIPCPKETLSKMLESVLKCK
jgi:hypothetical protein